MLTEDPGQARRAVALLVREIDEATQYRRADDDEFLEAAAQARDVLANSASMLETLQHIERLTLAFFEDPAAEPNPAQLLSDIFLLARVALEVIDGVTEQ
jgi:hypothetical protein